MLTRHGAVYIEFLMIHFCISGKNSYWLTYSILLVLYDIFNMNASYILPHSWWKLFLAIVNIPNDFFKIKLLCSSFYHFLLISSITHSLHYHECCNNWFISKIFDVTSLTSHQSSASEEPSERSTTTDDANGLATLNEDMRYTISFDPGALDSTPSESEKSTSYSINEEILIAQCREFMSTAAVAKQQQQHKEHLRVI